MGSLIFLLKALFEVHQSVSSQTEAVDPPNSVPLFVLFYSLILEKLYKRFCDFFKSIETKLFKTKHKKYEFEIMLNKKQTF